MKTGIERLQQQKAESNRKMAEAAEKLAELKRQRADLENRVNAAIAECDQGAAEKLIRSRMDIDVQIEIAQKTLTNMKDSSVDRDAVSEAWKDECSGYQNQINKAEKELHKLMQQTIEKAVEIADMVNSAWSARVNALRLINDKESYTYNAGNKEFPMVSCPASEIRKIRDILPPEKLSQIRSDAGFVISEAIRDKSNPFWRRH